MKNGIAKLIKLDFQKRAFWPWPIPNRKELSHYLQRAYNPWYDAVGPKEDWRDFGLRWGARGIGIPSAAFLTAVTAPKLAPAAAAAIPAAKATAKATATKYVPKAIQQQGAQALNKATSTAAKYTPNIVKNYAPTTLKTTKNLAMLNAASEAGREALWNEGPYATLPFRMGAAGMRGAYDAATSPATWLAGATGNIHKHAPMMVYLGSAGKNIAQAFTDPTQAELYAQQFQQDNAIAKLINAAAGSGQSPQELINGVTQITGEDEVAARRRVEDMVLQHVRAAGGDTDEAVDAYTQLLGPPSQQPQPDPSQPTAAPDAAGITTQQFLQTPSPRRFQLDEDIAGGLQVINSRWNLIGSRARAQLAEMPDVKAIFDQAYQQLQSGETDFAIELAPQKLQEIQAQIRSTLPTGSASINKMLQSIDNQISQQLMESRDQLAGTLQADDPSTFLQQHMLPPEQHDEQAQYITDLFNRHNGDVEAILAEDPDYTTKLEQVTNSAVAHGAANAIQEGRDPSQYIQELLDGNFTTENVETLKNNLADEVGTNPNTPDFLNYFMDWFSQADNVQLAAVGIGIPLALAGLATAVLGENAFLGILMTMLGIASTAVGVTGAHNTLLPYFTQFFGSEAA